MGGRRGNHYPAFQTFITGIDTPFAEGGTALLRCSSLRFFLFIGILVFCLPMPDNMIRKDTKNAARRK